MPTPGGVMVWRSVCAPWVSLWVWLLMGVKVARLVGDGVAVVVFIILYCFYYCY